MMIQRINHRYGYSGILMGVAVLIAALCISMTILSEAFSAAAGQKAFPSPEVAVSAFVSAVKANDSKELVAILGPVGKGLVSSGDPVADQSGRERFLGHYAEMNKLVSESATRVVLHIGTGDWPFPIPIVKHGTQWVFNTKEGREEILNRRIGKNELNAIEVCRAILNAEREYVLKDHDGDGVKQYARKFRSDEGKRNGLYWKVTEGEAQSPLGPLVAKAEGEGYLKDRKKGDKPSPYHGYFYKILTSQSRHAGGGECNYVVRGRMIGGFAVVAYPAEYGNSGIMTFIMNHDGVIYQKNLGKDTVKLAKEIKTFDPDKTWKKVE